MESQTAGHDWVTFTFFQQHKRWLYTWTPPNGQYQNQIDYILGSRWWRSPIQSANTRPGVDCGSDQKLLIAKFRLKLKKKGKTTRPSRYDLTQIPYDYTVEVTNRFKALDLKECLKNCAQRFMTLYRRQWSRPQEKEMQKGKMAVWGGLTKSWENKRSERQRRKGKVYPLAEFQRIARRDKKAFLCDQCKEIRGKQQNGKD